MRQVSPSWWLLIASSSWVETGMACNEQLLLCLYICTSMSVSNCTASPRCVCVCVCVLLDSFPREVGQPAQVGQSLPTFRPCEAPLAEQSCPGCCRHQASRVQCRACIRAQQQWPSRVEVVSIRNLVASKHRGRLFVLLLQPTKSREKTPCSTGLWWFTEKEMG